MKVYKINYLCKRIKIKLFSMNLIIQNLNQKNKKNYFSPKNYNILPIKVLKQQSLKGNYKKRIKYIHYNWIKSIKK